MESLLALLKRYSVYTAQIKHKKTQLTDARVTRAQQRRHSKMAVSRHLGFYQNGNSAVRSAIPKTLA